MQLTTCASAWCVDTHVGTGVASVTTGRDTCVEQTAHANIESDAGPRFPWKGPPQCNEASGCGPSCSVPVPVSEICPRAPGAAVMRWGPVPMHKFLLAECSFPRSLSPEIASCARRDARGNRFVKLARRGGRWMVCARTRFDMLQFALPFWVWGRFHVLTPRKEYPKKGKKTLVFFLDLGPQNGDHFPGPKVGPIK